MAIIAASAFPATAFAAPVSGPQAADARVAQEAERGRTARAQGHTAAERERRRASRRAHSGLSRAEALDLAEARHPEFVLLPAWRAFALPPGSRVAAYESDFAARLAGPDGGRMVLSNVPMLSAVRDGTKRPVDLSLERHGDALRPVNPLADVTLSERISDGLLLRGIGVAVRPLVADDPAPLLSGDTLFYGNAMTDADVLVRPTVGGFAVHVQLRSEDSPEQVTLELDAPAGVTLHEMRAHGVIEMRRGDVAIGTITAPAVLDADGRHVDAAWRLDGGRLEIDVPHRGRDLAYPLLVDPKVVETFEWERYGVDGGYGNTEGWNYLSQGNFGNHGFAGNSTWLGSGLHIRNLGTTYYYNDGEDGKWMWRAPGFARLSQVEWNLVDQDGVEATELELGVVRRPVDESAGRSWYDATGNPVRRTDRFSAHYFRTCALSTCADGAGNPGDEAQFGIVARGSGYRTRFAAQVGVVYLHVNDVDVPAVASGLPREWVNWPSTQNLDFWAVDPSTGVSEMTFSATGWRGAVVGPETYSTLRCRRTSLCPRAHRTAGDGRVKVDNMPEGVNTISLVTKDPANNLRTSASSPALTGPGLRADYFDNADFTSHRRQRVDPTVDFDWGAGSPDGAVGAEGFSARWMGYLDVPSSGTYSFQTSTDDGVRLWVNELNVPLIDDWRQHGETARTASRSLAAGRYPIVMEYFENVGGAAAHLRWRPPGASSFVPIPSARLSPPADWKLRLDRGDPTFQLGGELVQDSGQPLVGDAYELWVDALDESAAGPRAGVRSIEIALRPPNSTSFQRVAFAEQQCPENSCPLDLDWTFRRDQWGTGSFEVRTTVLDWANNDAVQTFSFSVGPRETDTPSNGESAQRRTDDQTVDRRGTGGCAFETGDYGGSHVDHVVDAGRGSLGFESTVFYTDGSYEVIHCGPLKEVQRAQHVAPIPTPEGVRMLVVSDVIPNALFPSELIVEDYTYMAPDDPLWIQSWPTTRAEAFAQVIPPTTLPTP